MCLRVWRLERRKGGGRHRGIKFVRVDPVGVADDGEERARSDQGVRVFRRPFDVLLFSAGPAAVQLHSTAAALQSYIRIVVMIRTQQLFWVTPGFWCYIL